MTSVLDRFATPHRPGALFGALNPLWSEPAPDGTMPGRIESVRPTGERAAAISIRPARSWSGHRAGQYVSVGVDVDGVRHHRCFSLTSVSDPLDGLIEITVQAHRNGTVSEHLVRMAQPGEIVRLSHAQGDFTPAGHMCEEPQLFVSAGSGITPFVAILRELGARITRSDGCWSAGRPDVVLIHFATSRPAVLHGAEMEALAAAMPWLRLELVLTRDNDGQRRNGRHLDSARLGKLCSDWRERGAWICGPSAMLEFAETHWAADGLSNRLHVESYHPVIAPVVDPGSEGPFAVSFGAAQASVPAGSGETLLAVAESAGLRPATGCRMGICHTCTTELCSGTARDLRDGHLVDAPDHVQICVSGAATDLSLDL